MFIPVPGLVQIWTCIRRLEIHQCFWTVGLVCSLNILADCVTESLQNIALDRICDRLAASQFLNLWVFQFLYPGLGFVRIA